jgi:hypothetical protein
MPEDGAVPRFGRWMERGIVNVDAGGGLFQYAVPHARSEDLPPRPSPVVGVSVEERLTDLIQSYPHLAAFLRSHAKEPDARIRDLAISNQEREQLLFEIMAARRQQQRIQSGTQAPPRHLAALRRGLEARRAGRRRLAMRLPMASRRVAHR